MFLPHSIASSFRPENQPLMDSHRPLNAPDNSFHAPATTPLIPSHMVSTIPIEASFIPSKSPVNSDANHLMIPIMTPTVVLNIAVMMSQAPLIIPVTIGMINSITPIIKLNALSTASIICSPFSSQNTAIRPSISFIYGTNKSSTVLIMDQTVSKTNCTTSLIVPKIVSANTVSCGPYSFHISIMYCQTSCI